MDSAPVAFSAGVLTFLIFLVVGVGCTFYPYPLQQILMGEKRHFLSFLAPRSRIIRSYVESRWYIWHLRVCGVIALAGAAVALFGLARFMLHRAIN